MDINFTVNIKLVIVLLVLVTAVVGYLAYQLRKSEKQQKNHLDKTRAWQEELENREALDSLLRNIFDSSLNGIIAFASVRNTQNKIVDFTYELANEVAAEISGQSLDTLINKTMLNVLPGNKDSGLFDAYAQVVHTGDHFKTTMHYCHDGIDKWFAISAVKNLDGFIVTFSDISEFKQQEQLLLLKQQELEEANSELEQFLYIASHDLQEPLRKVRAFGDRLEATYAEQLDEKGKDFISRMCNASARMQKLIDDLLTYSKTAQMHIDMSELDLNSVVTDAKDLLSELITEKSAVITHSNLPTLIANPSQMLQLFLNIISNALKYVEDGVSPVINISAQDTMIEINNVMVEAYQLSITDNGIGFENSQTDKIFEIFQRLHGHTEYNGTGIGLAICAKIVANHKGNIKAHSELGEGATFVIELPKAMA